MGTDEPGENEASDGYVWKTVIFMEIDDPAKISGRISLIGKIRRVRGLERCQDNGKHRLRFAEAGFQPLRCGGPDTGTGYMRLPCRRSSRNLLNKIANNHARTLVGTGKVRLESNARRKVRCVSNIAFVGLPLRSVAKRNSG
jgi:hypothetical protein